MAWLFGKLLASVPTRVRAAAIAKALAVVATASGLWLAGDQRGAAEAVFRLFAL